MSNSTLFKKIAAENIPEHLYQQLETHIDSLLNTYEERKQEYDEYKQQYDYINYLNGRDASKRYNQIRAEFELENSPMWPAFARERWPEIDKFFNLSPSSETDSVSGWEDDLPF